MTDSYVARLFSELGLSGVAISALLSEDTLEITRLLISHYFDREDDNEKIKLIFLLECVGDVELTGNFFVDVLKTGNDLQKLFVSMEAHMDKFKGHQKLREVLDDHLKGLLPAEVFIRDSKIVCPVK